MRYYPLVDWDSMYSSYSLQDCSMIASAFFYTCYKMWEQIGRVEVFQEPLKVEFVPEQTELLKAYNAQGLAYPDHNINIMPRNLSRFDLQIHSGIFSMELAHSVFYRVTGDWLAANDVVHFLYNEGYLKNIEYVSWRNFRDYGGHLNIVMPDVAYGLQKRNEIMEGIKSGKYRASFNPYWGAPTSTYKGSPGTPIAAEKYDLEHIKAWLARND